ncbi:SpoIIE family protein phosphatase [uncultured Treponema sp.]|uniref:SpoIIE family protein phosphatase n=1 Tax=uncultured Treponema sp. TaxID=162155 RepID=UPI0025DAB768|nr:SpoIIE family protein phosphatase [uncultured Treponema sp.]
MTKQKNNSQRPKILRNLLFVLIFFLSMPIFAQQKESFYWDSLHEISGKNSFFPVTLCDSTDAYIFFESVDKSRQEIKISWKHKKGSLDWSKTFSLNDSFKYSAANVPDLYSAAISPSGAVALSVLDSSTAKSLVRVYLSEDHASSFSSFEFPASEKTVTSSRIFASGDSGFILFVSLGEGRQTPMESSFSLLYSESSDGKNWSPLKSFEASESIANAFSPFFVKIRSRDFVFFEGWSGKDFTTSLIYAAFRENERDSKWSEPFLVTDESSMLDSSESYLNFKNFRPFVLSDGEETKMIWERTSKTGNSASIIVSPLSDDGKITDRNDVELLSEFGNARRPSLFLFKNKFFALWFDDRNGHNNVHLSENLGVQWAEVDSVLLRQDKSSEHSFPCPLTFMGEREFLSLVWQEEKDGRQTIRILDEDFNVALPELSAKNFKAKKRSNIKNPSVRVIMPKDSSGIAGYSSLWTFDSEQQPEKDMLGAQFKTVTDNLIQAKIPEGLEGDQILYFKAAVLDKAGNWSDTAVLEYYFDQTAPKKVREISYEKDEWGFASSNDIAFSWKNSDESDDVAGYSWSLTKIASLDKKLAVTRRKKFAISYEESEVLLSSILDENAQNLSKAKIPSSKIQGTKSSVSFRNRDNGLYVFSVRAIDSVGNAGEPESCVLFLNKYRAATLISKVDAQSDDLGNVYITISGQEFSYDGEISQVLFTERQSGEKYVFNLKDGDYSVKKIKNENEQIVGIKIEGMKAGNYTVQIRHSERGLSAWGKALLIKENGTVKYEKVYNFEPVWESVPLAIKEFSIESERILFYIIMLFILLGILVCSRGLVLTAKDIFKIRKDVVSIVTGENMSEELERMESKIKVQFSLRMKFGFAITALLLFIVAGVALAIGYQMSNTQERILIAGLKDRVKVVMGNMSSGVQSYLDDGREKLVELGAIVNQVDNFAESKFATILSHEIDGKTLSDGSRPLDYVWATNDDEILQRINESVFDAGTVRFTPADNLYKAKCNELNSEAKILVADLELRTTDIDSAVIFKKLNELSASRFSSYPDMSDTALDSSVTEYYFFWPVMYQKGNDRENFLQAMIIMQVSTETLLKQIESSQRIVMSIAFIAGFVAAIIGLFSAFSLSSLIVLPIRRVVSHVKKITETENKLLLEGVEIKITSHDELRTLGDSVNEMTKGLVKGAKDEERAKIASQRAAIEREKAARAQAEEAKARAEAAEMSIMNLDGQAVQKAFIPLVSEGTEKETVAELKEKEIQLYGYYEGTDAVSGDYFDYKKLDDRWYAFIKCDASGHGVPAALIMTIVATIFRRYFADWKFEKNGIKLNLLAADINDFIESLGLRGKFAAMMICLFDTKTGDVYTCNAGDNILRVFDSVEKKIKVITLHEAPAAGPLPSFLVEMKGGYKVEKIKLKANDVLFLYTDGIEESTRFFRNSDFEIIACDEGGLKDGDVHATHKKGEKSEQMEPSRVQDVIESVLNRKKYVLKKYHAPIADEKLEFDFTKCEGTIEDVIIALTAVEKVFRMYKKPGSKGRVEKTEMDLDGKRKTVIQISGDGIKIDRKIDAFLKKYFNRYDYYCSNQVDEGETNYIYYTGVNEDVQADDLTLLAIKRM